MHLCMGALLLYAIVLCAVGLILVQQLQNTVRSALDISAGPLARRTFQTAGPVHFFLSLARTGHLDICRATRFQIVLA